MLTIFAAGLMVASIVAISSRLILRKSDNRKRLRRLTMLWIASVLLAALLLAVVAAQSYVAPDKVYRGYWYVVGTGEKVRDVFSYVGGAGMNPFVAFLLFSMFFTLGGFIIGAAIAFAKDAVSKRSAGPLKILLFPIYFVLYYLLNGLTAGIYPILRLYLSKTKASQASHKSP